MNDQRLAQNTNSNVSVGVHEIKFSFKLFQNISSQALFPLLTYYNVIREGQAYKSNNIHLTQKRQRSRS
jgi:hypothetical protein